MELTWIRKRVDGGSPGTNVASPQSSLWQPTTIFLAKPPPLLLLWRSREPTAQCPAVLADGHDGVTTKASLTLS
jgi:hypothetical protein